MKSLRDQIRNQLADLRIPGSLEALDQVLSRVDKGLGAAEAISADQTAQQPPSLGGDAEQSAPGRRNPHGLRLQLPAPLKRDQIEGLATLGFVERKENVVFLGPPGVGKTPLAIGLAIAAAQSGQRVYCATLADLITSPEKAHAAGKLLHRLKTLTHPSLLVVDEIGYLPISRTGAMYFFQLMRGRYEHGSTVLTSNKSFEEWGEVLGDEVLAAALIDRLLHHCHIVNIRGNSYRMRTNSDVWKQLHHSSEGDRGSASVPPRRSPRRKEVRS